MNKLAPARYEERYYLLVCLLLVSVPESSTVNRRSLGSDGATAMSIENTITLLEPVHIFL